MSDHLLQYMHTDGSGLGQSAGGFSQPEGQKALRTSSMAYAGEAAIADLGQLGSSFT